MDARGRMLLSRGEQVAGYEIEDYIARGGMAVVYRARDLSLGRRVALKLIAPELAENEKFRQRFIRESELAASIDHPNILPIYQAGESEGLLYIAMRYVAGQDLGVLLEQHGPLTADVALPLFTQIAAALDTAHAHGLVHRDIKPGNILIDRADGPISESHIYLTDFGLTKRSSSLSGFTTAGHFIGTIAYVAPEQIAGQEVTQQADVYAMGCVLYETLAGVPPFQRDDDAALLWAHMSMSPVPLSQLRPDLPATVDEVLHRAMAKDPEHRTPSCRAVVSQLRAAFRAAPVAAQPISPLVQDVPDPGPGEAGEAGDAGDGSGRRGFLRRYGWRALTAVGLLVLVAAAFVLFPRMFRAAYVPYNGSSSSASWLAFDRPRQWQVRPNLSKTCFCTDQYDDVLETGDWRNVISAIDDGVSVEGLYVETSRRLDLEDAVVVRQQIDSFLSRNKKVLGTPAVASIGGRSGWETDGTLTASKDPSLRLTIRYFLVLSADGSTTYNLVLFAQDKRFSQLSGRLDHVAGSVRFRDGS